MDGFEINGIGGGYSLNYPEIVKQKDVMAVTKLLAHQLMENPYIVVGDFIKEMSDTDLHSLQEAIEQEHFEDIILMAEMLATGEGCDQSENFDAFTDRANILTTFLTIESLGRKGLVKVHHDKISFHEDARKNVVVERIEGLDYQSLVDRFK